MMRGVSFNGQHSWRDLHLVLSDVDIPPAKPKLNYVAVPGRDGDVDLTEANGDVRYETRNAIFTFSCRPEDDFEQKKCEISRLLNGQRCNIIVDKDPGYYWEGRCTINDYATNKAINKIVVGAALAPYKLKNSETRVTVYGGSNVQRVLSNGRKRVTPAVTCTYDTTIDFDGHQLHFGPGTHTNLAFALKPGPNTVWITSSSTVTIAYREGEL